MHIFYLNANFNDMHQKKAEVKVNEGWCSHVSSLGFTTVCATVTVVVLRLSLFRYILCIVYRFSF